MNVDDAVKFAKEKIEEVARMARDPRQQEEISEELSDIEKEIARVGSNMTAAYKAELSTTNDTMVDEVGETMKRMRAERDDIKGVLDAREKDEKRIQEQGPNRVDILHSRIVKADKEIMKQFQETSKTFNKWLSEQRTLLMNSLLRDRVS
ncbi:hypothetical protein Pmar_PMAR006423 [Perkinsus marinus ATCC 50983]|uniref:Uncharacterized protein n=1 Tax=Perkinsus marinus (strain ATCC 50983 / TXsc) TaxID=423536 RepID=C5K9N1_PERM5|nr:hypothetical protein Pmar_PMAR006423 [Perkinsus marinus ATCC 50983]EER18803.1 hypothetical protein Pmar_PMAR006423 [Perkinsus marinus ATCC 50983]|eukprot:XP_002787007.1 hypothetical protein Pmar_PMAR006423 [Perkinsus marinus ATCC 50983]